MNSVEQPPCKACDGHIHVIRRLLKTHGGIKRHVPNMNGLIQPPAKLRIYTCQRCGMESKTLVSLFQEEVAA
jgi:hypothetical protein